MTYDRPHETPTQPQPPSSDLNLVNLNGNRNDNSNRNSNDNRNNNANDNRNYNGNNNRNDNANHNNNRNDNTNNNSANSRSNSDANASSNSRSDSRSNSDARATGGNSASDARATGGNAAGGSAAINDHSVNKTTVYGGSAYAPDVRGGGFCSEGGSAGVYVLGIGVSGGKTTINETCMKKEDFQRTMVNVCTAADNKSSQALNGWSLQLQAGRELNTNAMAQSVAMSAKRMADAKAKTALELDSVCGTMAATADGTMEALKRAGLDKPVIIVEDGRNPQEQKQIDEALLKKVDELDKRVSKVESTPTAVIQQNQITFIEMEAPKPAPRPVHRPTPKPESKPEPKPQPKADDCVDETKKKK
ncbi:MAG: hypothetical protein K2Y32_06135 [Candidatus Obscuribacterales bacterium]|nr:hypothetical protein [Candidatus Obscuribacterales bacterium]